MCRSGQSEKILYNGLCFSSYAALTFRCVYHHSGPVFSKHLRFPIYIRSLACFAKAVQPPEFHITAIFAQDVISLNILQHVAVFLLSLNPSDQLGLEFFRIATT